MNSAQTIDQHLSGLGPTAPSQAPNLALAQCLHLALRDKGVEIGAEQVTRACLLSQFDGSLTAFDKVAQRLGLDALVISTQDLGRLAELHLPCIAQLDDGFYVIKRLDQDQVSLVSAQRRAATVPRHEFDRRVTGAMLHLAPVTRISKSVQGDIKLSQLYAGIRGLKGTVSVIFMLSVAVQLFAIVVPLFAQLTIDKIIPNQDINLLLITCLGFGLVLSLDAATKALRGYYATNLLAYLNSNTLSSVFDHLIHLQVGFFERYSLGDILSRFKSIEPLNGQITNTFVSIIMDTLMVLSMAAIMAIYAPGIALISLVFAAAVICTRFCFNGTLKRLHREACEFYAESSNHFIETFSSIQSIRVYRSEKLRHRIWLEKHLKAIGRDESRIKLSISADVIAELLGSAEMIIVIALIATRVIDAEMTVGAMFAYLSYRTLFATHASSLIKNAFELRQLSVFLQRIGSIVGEPRLLSGSVAESNIAIECEPGTTVEVESLSYAPTDAARPLFKDFSLTIKAGSLVVITGASGSGKSTLMKLMLGLLPPTAGIIRLDGRRIGPFHRHSAARISAVLQGDRLFSGSILENIVGNAPVCDLERVIDCCKMAGVHEEVIELEAGYETIINRGEPNISMGQEQRLMFARALYQQPSILFLDEATSNLDANNERLLNERISALSMTRVVIAHRGNIAQYADQIVNLTPLVGAQSR